MPRSARGDSAAGPGPQVNGVDHGGAELETAQLNQLGRDDDADFDEADGGGLADRDRSDQPGLGGQAGPLDLALGREAVAGMSSPGRLEIVRRSLVVIVDAAHNPAGMAATVAALQEAFSFTDLIAVLSISADKDIAGILDELQPVATQFVATRNASGRAMDAEDLADAAESVFGAERVTIAPHLPDQAIEVAVGLADEGRTPTPRRAAARRRAGPHRRLRHHGLRAPVPAPHPAAAADPARHRAACRPAADHQAAVHDRADHGGGHCHRAGHPRRDPD